ncbi:hypothetical protein [Bacillus sp. 165]|uniref:hypothetical protein n=1 Tax=Bacillus sp. 165 TaxID=1529117 RepID=UPI001ADBAEA6|nr:hypothetical protein [Bacillus sp. 165]MBO9128755.1 hypothetical protein [Bacillus sp. 165]
MGLCPRCNGFTNSAYQCPSCLDELQDCGRTVDYLDDYSAYMDQQLLEQVDGLKEIESGIYCMHVFYCATCRQELQLKVDLM